MRRLFVLFLIGWLAVEAPPAGWLGLTVQELTPQIAMRLGIRVREGVFVAAVQSGSPADRGGIRAGDVLLSLDGKKIATPEALRQEVSKISPGTSIEVRLYRDQRERTVQISVGAPPRDAA